MALHDVDKGNVDRSSPAVNAHDNTGEVRMAHGTTSVHPITDASTAVGFTQTKNGRLLISDGANIRIIIGELPNGEYGFAVSKAGYNVADIFS